MGRRDLSHPRLSLVVPTKEPARWPRFAKLSMVAAAQMQRGDEYIVVYDDLGGEDRYFELRIQLEPVREFLAQREARFRILRGGQPVPSWGHRELNYGLAVARGDWLLANDDDDCWTGTALHDLRDVIARLDQPRPLLCRFESHFGPVYWSTRGMVAENHIGGHCLVQPNVPGKVGKASDRYQGDFDWIADTLAKWAPDEPAWVDLVIAVARPSDARLEHELSVALAVSGELVA